MAGMRGWVLAATVLGTATLAGAFLAPSLAPAGRLGLRPSPLACRQRSQRLGAAGGAAGRARMAEDAVVPVIGAEGTAVWTWRGYSVRYSTAGLAGSKTPIVMVHGFGSSGDTWRNQFATLAAEGHPVYAIDLLGFGRSQKPTEAPYSIELWKDQVLDFVEQVVGADRVILFGNSIGSLVSCTAAACPERRSKVEGLVLMNCAAGMNNKFIVTGTKTSPIGKVVAGVLFALLDFLLSLDSFASWFFERTRSVDNVSQVLRNVYVNKDAVDTPLVRSILDPADDPNALEVFVKILTGDPGKTPDTFMDQIKQPMLLVWGDEDPLTPLKVGYGPYFAEELVQGRPLTELAVVNAGHCPHDDDPAAVNAAVVDWLSRLPAMARVAA